MGANNFVSRLQKHDFLEFAIKAGIITKNYEIFEISIRCDGDVRVIYKRKVVFFKNKKENDRYIVVYYFDFCYLNLTTRSTTKKQNCLWRNFVAKRLGTNYISAYEKSRQQEIEEKHKKVDELESKYMSEITKLRENMVDGKEKS